MKPSRILLAILAALHAPTATGESRPAWLELTQADGAVTIEPFANLGKGHEGRYRLEVIKSGPGGRSVNRQSGVVPVSQGSPVGPLSVSRVSLEPGASLRVVLEVTDSTGTVFEAERSLPGE